MTPQMRALALIAIALLLAGCATTPAVLSPEAAARPQWRAGERWIFIRTSATGAVRFVTHEVTGEGPEGYVLRISGTGRDITQWWTRDLHIARQEVVGRGMARYDPPAPYFTWPLALGKEWTQTYTYQDERGAGSYTNRWRIGKEEELVKVPAGSFMAVRIERLGAGDVPLDTYWYASVVRYWVKLESYAGSYGEELMDRGSGS